MNPDEVKEAVIAENVAAFKQVKGIGPKTAKQIILDLKDMGVFLSASLPRQYRDSNRFKLCIFCISAMTGDTGTCHTVETIGRLSSR